MKYEFITSTGKVEIDVDERYNDILITMDKDWEKDERRHDRHRHKSLNDADYEGEWFSDGADILGDLIRNEDHESMRKAMKKLKPDQQILVEQVYFKNEKIVDIAKENGVSQSAISQRLITAIKKLKKLL